MGATMRWQNYSDQHETIREAETIVSDVVTDIRNRGHRTPHAFEQAALTLGLSRRKVRELFYGEAGAIAREALETMRRLFLAHLDDEAEHAMRRASQRTATRKRLQQERDKTLEMRRGVDGTGEGMLRAGVAGVGDLVAVPADREIPGLDRSENVDPGCEREDAVSRGCASITRD